jgi:hypothetical protein
MATSKYGKYRWEESYTGTSLPLQEITAKCEIQFMSVSAARKFHVPPIRLRRDDTP